MDSPTSQVPDSEPVSQTFSFLNSLDDVAKLSDWLYVVADQLGFSDKLTFRLDLVLIEVVTNIINYAYDDEQPHEITVRLQAEGSNVTLEVEDDGRDFDPTQTPDVVRPTSLEEAQIGGLGIHLIRHYTDACRYQRQGDKNILTLVLSDPQDETVT